MRDVDWGKGRAHLFELNFEGNTVRSIHRKSDNECEYHPSGIVLTEETIFIALAQYAPDTSAMIIKFDVNTQPISIRVASLGKLTHQDTMRASVRKLILATGVTAGRMEYFGLDIIDVASWEIRASLRWPSPPHTTRGGWPPFANPTFLWVDSYDRVLALATPRLPRRLCSTC